MIIGNTFDELSSSGPENPDLRDLSDVYSRGSVANKGFLLKAICPLKVCILAMSEGTVYSR